MTEFEIRDNAIWAKHLTGRLHDRVMNMEAGAFIELEIDGIVGRWQKMRIGKDGRPTQGLKPVGAMGEIWKTRFFPGRKHEFVTIREARTAETYLEGMTSVLDEWNSTADEEAYRDLQPV